jgi:predicted transcriptional regulator
MSKRTTIEIPENLAARLDTLAALLERSREWVVEQALTCYIDESMDNAVKIAEALALLRSGEAKLIPHEEVFARMEERLRAMEADADHLARSGRKRSR